MDSFFHCNCVSTAFKILIKIVCVPANPQTLISTCIQSLSYLSSVLNCCWVLSSLCISLSLVSTILGALLLLVAITAHLCYCCGTSYLKTIFNLQRSRTYDLLRHKRAQDCNLDWKEGKKREANHAEEYPLGIELEVEVLQTTLLMQC